MFGVFFFFKQKTAYEMRISDWSSDVCSSDLSFSPGPRTIWFTAEVARLALGLGHVSLINLAVQTRFGSGLLRPFKAAGRVAFSLYFLQQLLGMWVLFAPWGFNLWGRFGWASMSAIAFAVIAGEIVLANLWLRHFVSGQIGRAHV